jgi:hypothetical protein
MMARTCVYICAREQESRWWETNVGRVTMVLVHVRTGGCMWRMLPYSRHQRSRSGSSLWSHWPRRGLHLGRPGRPAGCRTRPAQACGLSACRKCDPVMAVWRAAGKREAHTSAVGSREARMFASAWIKISEQDMAMVWVTSQRSARTRARKC